jgi:hypothetical protein
VIRRIDAECWRIYVVDDACPEQSGRVVETQCSVTRAFELSAISRIRASAAQ